MRVGVMPTEIMIDVTAADRERLLAIRANPSSPRKHVWRAATFSLTTEGHGTAEIMDGGRHQDRGLALARAVHARRRRGSAARQDAPVAHSAAAARDRRESGEPHSWPTAGRDHPLDGAGDGSVHWHQRQFGVVRIPVILNGQSVRS
jgi:hypothetical protein